ncbi:helix-turn-helix domain-containing protein [Streptomyces goshikiensis]|uniref:helix-turn-helix domain-containing protein n=1 Tax=Streptomyces goshikiensis TaxID=1942 RepID=UPI0036A2C4FF
MEIEDDFHELDRLLSSREAAQLVHVTPECIRKWVSRGYLKQATKHKGRSFFRTEDILLVDRNRRKRRTGWAPRS